MGFLENTIKKYLSNFREKFAKPRKESDSEGEHLYETLSSSPGSSKNSDDSGIKATPAKRGNDSLERKSEQSSDCSSPDISLDGDSGISEPLSLQKKTKKIQFGANLVHVFERENQQFPPSLHKVKYFETPPLQAPDIMDCRSTQKPQYLEDHPHYLESRDLVEAPSLAARRPEPPKLPHLRRKFNTTDIEIRTDNKRNCISFDSHSSMTDDLKLTLPFMMGRIEDGTTHREKRELTEAEVLFDSNLSFNTTKAQIYILPSKEPQSILLQAETEPIYAQITPRDSKNLEVLKEPTVLIDDQDAGQQKKRLLNTCLDSDMWNKTNSELKKEVAVVETETKGTDIKVMETEQLLKGNMCKEKEEIHIQYSPSNGIKETKSYYAKDISTPPFTSGDVMNLKYFRLKKFRDVECSRMAQASKALEQIKLKKDKDWLEELVAERVLLETSERIKLATQQIHESTYASIPEPPLHKGTIRLSNIAFPFAKQLGENIKTEKHFTEFFLLTISQGTRMYISEVITGEQEPLRFRHEYNFADVAPDFEIKVKLFCLRLRTSPEYFWNRFLYSGCCPTSRIIYEDHLTRQYQEKTVLKTSFKLVAEVTLTSSQINESSSILKVNEQVFDKLVGTVEHHFKCEDVDMTISLSGFLDVGSLLGETYFWERKWCALKGPNLLIYNYPQDESFGNSVEQINLKYCFGPIVTKVENCPKRRCFQLKTGRPIKSNSDKPVATLRSKPNFAVRKFFFAANNMDDYIRWTVEVEKLLKSMSYFKKLVFDREYEDCYIH